MNTSAPTELRLVRHGPLYHGQQRLGLIRTDRGLDIGRRIGLAVLATWLPIILLSLPGGRLFEHADPLLRHFGVHSRCLIAIPLLILAEGLAQTFIPLILGEFVRTGLVGEEKLPGFRLAIDKANRLLDSRLAFFLILGLAVLGAVLSVLHAGEDHETAWAAETGGGIASLGLAGWWFVLVAKPVFVVLLATWVWRVACLFLFFRTVSKLGLELAPTHPDRVGGLGFLEEAVVVLVPVVLAASTVLAANWAHNVLYHGLHVTSLKPLVIAYLLLNLAIFLSPWLAFMPILKQFKRKSRLAYGALLTRHGQMVDRRWMRGEEAEDAGLLSAPELGPVADVSSLFEIVEGIRSLPLRKKAAVQIVLAALLPMVPVFAIELPVKDILKQLLGTLVL